MFLNKKGFTLLELMIVVIIVAVLASLAMPRFIDARNRAITAEAYNMLGAIRSSQMRYYLQNSSTWATTVGDLDISAPVSEYFDWNGAESAAYSDEDDVVGQADGKAGTAMASVVIDIEADGDFAESGL